MANKAGTVTLLDIASRTYPAGTTTSPTYTVPAGVTTVSAAFTIADADAADPTKSLTFECDRFDVPSQTWKFDHGFTWVGGVINFRTGLPFQPQVTVDGLAEGTQLRALLTPNAPLTTAISLTAL